MLEYFVAKILWRKMKKSNIWSTECKDATITIGMDRRQFLLKKCKATSLEGLYSLCQYINWRGGRGGGDLLRKIWKKALTSYNYNFGIDISYKLKNDFIMLINHSKGDQPTLLKLNHKEEFNKVTYQVQH